MKLGHGNMAKVISGPIVNNRIANSCDDSFLDIMKLGLILFVKIQTLNTSKEVTLHYPGPRSPVVLPP